MREIKFRGKRIDNDEWIYGDLIKPKSLFANRHYILKDATFGNVEEGVKVGNFIEVDPKTVGQYTGLKDKNGKEIYEGGILREPLSPVGGEDGGYRYGNRVIKWEGAGRGYKLFHPSAASEVIGNIHENPELLEK